MSRPIGQNPKVRVKERANGLKHYFFQYWTHVPGQEARKRKTYIVGLASQMTKSEANRKKVEFILSIESQFRKCHSPSEVTFATAVSHYRNVFAPRMLRASTFSTADGHLKTHLEVDWKHLSIEYITIDAINEWIWKKRDQGLSWITIKNVLRTMQRVLSSFSKDNKPPFYQLGLAIPGRDKPQMRISGRRKVSFSWAQAERISDYVGKMDKLGETRRTQYSTLVLLAAASGLRSSELLALRVENIDLSANTVRVEESSDQRNLGKIGPCKNASAYRTVLLCDSEGQKAIYKLRGILEGLSDSRSLIFHSKSGGPLLATNILNQGFYAALDALDLRKQDCTPLEEDAIGDGNLRA